MKTFFFKMTEFCKRSNSGTKVCQGDEVFRFCAVGGTNFLVSFTVYWGVYHFLDFTVILRGIIEFVGGSQIRTSNFSVQAAFANAVGYAAGITNSFILNKIWTFKSRQTGAGELKRFILWNILCLIFTSAGLFILVDVLGGPYMLVWFTVGLVSIAGNYLGYKYWVFTK